MKTLALAALAATIGFACPAAAACGPTEAVMKGLRENYGEVPMYIAIAGGTVVTVTVSPSDSWTMLGQSGPDIICALGSGEDWGQAPAAMRNARPPPPEKPS